jgi:hypothetical protein
MGTELKVVTGIDDHSRFCVLATLVPRATARRVWAAFAEVVIRDLRPMDSGPGDR